MTTYPLFEAVVTICSELTNKHTHDNHAEMAAFPRTPQALFRDEITEMCITFRNECAINLI
jgi:hypothetical protein